MDLSHVEVAGGMKGVDGLLGSPFFRTHKVRIDFATNRLVLMLKPESGTSAP